MRRGKWAAGAVVAAAALLAAGCGGSDGGGPKTTAVKAPAGGWPQPSGGRVTEAMCGLLTPEDYAGYGHQMLQPFTPKINGTVLSCEGMVADAFTVDLQPTIQAGKLVYSKTLQDHKDRLQEDARRTILANNVVQGADESWFDYWTLGTEGTQFTEYEINARRGALVVDITLSGIHGKNEKDPKTVLTGLAGLVLQRLPGVGAKDTGTTHKVRFEVTGSGKASQIMYTDPAATKSVTVKNVKLPWSKELPFVPQAGAQMPFNLSAYTNGFMKPVGCRISVDGQELKRQDSTTTATCLAFYTG
ncbi:MmpS family transport accessory protein [Actinomadura atramentaria]|uniref:MmpS family transport accessory protein n=1 Tax=Actinomadura atramentaria TaxID=1990 RepID=UPI0003A939B0|nr:MmpS family transport accessory protein [Actinomadura atramentaria]